MKTLFIALTLLLASAAFGQGVTDFEKAEKAFKKADAELNLVYGRLLKKLTDKKEEGASEKRYVVEEQRLWLSYRNAYGKLVAHQNSGSGSGTFEYGAKLELTQRRLKELLAQLEGYN